MTDEERELLAFGLELKANAVEAGEYGPSEPGEDQSWAGDLRHAAYLLREERVEDLNQSEREEIVAYDEDMEVQP
jgi:hypothetical protein